MEREGEAPPRSVQELLERVRSTIEHYDALYKDVYEDGDEDLPECLFEEFRPPLWRLILNLLGLIGLVVGFLGFTVVQLLFDEHETLGFAFAILGLLSLAWTRFEAWNDKRRNKKHHAQARVALGVVLQAAPQIMEPGCEDLCSGRALLTMDPELEREPLRLLDLAGTVARSRGRPDEELPPELIPIARDLDDEEHVAERRLPVPASLSGNEQSYVFDVIFDPQELPHGYSDRSLWFFLYHQTEHGVWTKPVPAALWWSEELDELWSF